MIQQKSSRTNAILMYVLSIFTFLVFLYDDRERENQTSNITTENQEFRHLQLLDRLDKLLISSSGYQDLARILKSVKSILVIKDAYFMLMFHGPINFMELLAQNYLRCKA